MLLRMMLAKSIRCNVVSEFVTSIVDIISNKTCYYYSPGTATLFITNTIISLLIVMKNTETLITRNSDRTVVMNTLCVCVCVVCVLCLVICTSILLMSETKLTIHLCFGYQPGVYIYAFMWKMYIILKHQAFEVVYASSGFVLFCVERSGACSISCFHNSCYDIWILIDPFP